MQIRPFFFTLIITLLSTHAWAEGAVRILQCSLEQECDPSANCTEESGNVIFSMEPLNIGQDGAGSYSIHYFFNDEDIQTSMEAKSFAGPFLWQRDSHFHTLLANSEASFLWHNLFLKAEPAASLHFLRCEFTQ